jgi:N6-adenosine-specific RNA methylase IME4
MRSNRHELPARTRKSTKPVTHQLPSGSRMTKLQFHPLADLFPLIEGEEFDALVDDIKTNGQHVPIVLYQEKVLDGRNRYRACLTAKMDPVTETYTGDNPLAHVISLNLKQRNLNETQRACVADKLTNLKEGRPSKTAQICAVSQDEAAKMLNVSRRLVQSAAKVREDGEPELLHAVEQGKLRVSLAANATKLTKAEQREVAKLAIAGEANVVKTVIKKRTRNLREKELAAKIAALPDAKFGVIYADPAWKFKFFSEKGKTNTSADNHYTCEDLDKIKALDVPSISAKDCVLFLWVTVPFEDVGHEVLKAWGFKYITSVIWVKDKTGIGYWFWNKHEVVLVGRKGKPVAPAPGTQFESVFFAPVGKHSKKPEKFAEMIEAYFPNIPKIELNRRGKPRPGWSAWGAETGEAEPDRNDFAEAAE